MLRWSEHCSNQLTPDTLEVGDESALGLWSGFKTQRDAGRIAGTYPVYRETAAGSIAGRPLATRFRTLEEEDAQQGDYGLQRMPEAGMHGNEVVNSR